MRNISQPLLVLTALVVACGLMVPAPAQACMEDICCTGCVLCGFNTYCCDECHICTAFLSSETEKPAGKTYVDFLSTTHARVTLTGYATTSLEPTQECIVGLAPVDGIAFVNSITNYDTRSNQPFSEVVFEPSAVAGFSASDAAREVGLEGGEPWHGFESVITGSVSDGVANHFVIDVTLADGISPSQFVQALKEEGVFLTGSSNQGIPDGDHKFFRRLRDTEFIVSYPSSDDRGTRVDLPGIGF